MKKQNLFGTALLIAIALHGGYSLLSNTTVKSEGARDATEMMREAQAKQDAQ